MYMYHVIFIRNNRKISIDWVPCYITTNAICTCVGNQYVRLRDFYLYLLGRGGEGEEGRRRLRGTLHMLYQS